MFQNCSGNCFGVLRRFYFMELFSNMTNKLIKKIRYLFFTFYLNILNFKFLRMLVYVIHLIAKYTQVNGCIMRNANKKAD